MLLLQADELQVPVGSGAARGYAMLRYCSALIMAYFRSTTGAAR